jgi:glycine/D-amino acid oxidase-like deaminating enzyme
METRSEPMIITSPGSVAAPRTSEHFDVVIVGAGISGVGGAYHLTKAAPPRVVALSSIGANRTSGLGMITALSLLEQGFRDLISPIAFVRAGGFFENFLYGLQVAQGGTLPVYYNPTKPEIDHGRDERHRRGGRNPFDRASLVRAARRRAWFDGHRG